MASKHPLTGDQLDPLLLRMPDGWAATEISTDTASAVLGINGDTIVGVAMSGVLPAQGAPLSMHGLEVVAGITVLRHEQKPRPGEPEGNADHYVITETNHPDAPYLRHGPFAGPTNCQGIPHWHDAEELGRFIDGIADQLLPPAPDVPDIGGGPGA